MILSNYGLTIPNKKNKDNNIITTLSDAQAASVDNTLFRDLEKGESKNSRIFKDPYSGEYYGEGDRNTFLTRFEMQLRSLDDNIKNYDTRNASTFRPFGAGAEGTSLESLQKTRENLQKSFDEFKTTKYNQSEQFFKSYEAYKPDWMNYFEGNYKNARLAEEYDNIESRQEPGALTSKIGIPQQSLSRGNLNTGLGISGGGGGGVGV